MKLKPPKSRPCGSCPYRLDVPSGVWSAGEYAKLPDYDRDTAEQPPAVFACHQQDGHICAGWAGCHNMRDSLGLRIAVSFGHISEADCVKTINYESSVPLFGSGREAAEHGMRDIEEPSDAAVRVVGKLERKLG